MLPRMKELRICLKRVEKPIIDSEKIDRLDHDFVRRSLLRNSKMLPRMKELRICLKRVDEPILASEKLNSKVVSMRSAIRNSYSKQISKNNARIHQCVICKKTFQTKYTLHYHIGCHTREKTYKCNTCGLEFRLPGQLKTHEATHQINRPRTFTCEECSKSFFDRHTLMQHVRSHRKKEFKCPICPKLFPDKSRISDHLTTHTREKPFSCFKKCGYRAAKRGSMIKHERRPHRNQCTHCDLCFVQKNDLQIHMQQHAQHSLDACQICHVTLSTTNEYICNICNKRLENISELSKHKLKHFKNRQFLCNLCNEDFESYDNIKLHMQKKHASTAMLKCSGCIQTFADETTAKENVQESFNSNEVPSVVVPFKQPSFQCKFSSNARASVETELVKDTDVHAKQGLFNCKFCEKFFPTVKRLYIHVRTHTGENPFKCDEKDCDRRFVTGAALKVHQERHSANRKRVQCTLCDSDKQYLPESLRNHMNRKHDATRKWKTCMYEDCKQTFMYNSELNEHVKLVHFREKCHKCELCEMKFFSTYELIRHLSTHTKKIKPHPCEYCKKAFSTKFRVEEHVRKLHNKEHRYFCMFCKKGFFYKGDLKVHFKTHTKERWEKCEKCDKGYAQKSDLRKHMIMVHDTYT